MSNSESKNNPVVHAPIGIDECGMALTLDILGDRWSMLIIREALYNVTRFEAFQFDLDIPRATLTDRLKKLEQHGIIKKSTYQEPRRRKRFEYELTECGKELALPLLALMQWGDKHLQKETSKAKLVHRITNKALYVAIVDQSGDVVAKEDIKFKVDK